MVSPSDEIRDDDFSKEHVMDVDSAEAQRKLRDVGKDAYDAIVEAAQNAIDSTEPDKPNRIEMTVGQLPYEPPFIILDHGDGITKDYDGSLSEFINAKKAISKKVSRTGTVGSKGIGILQYPHIAPVAIITSIDKDRDTGEMRMIYRIPIHLNSEGLLAFGKEDSEIAKEEKNQKKFGLSEPGTRVVFLNRDPKQKPIEIKEVWKRLKDQYAPRQAQNPNLHIFINGKELPLPKWIQNNPRKHITRLNGGVDVEGRIWADDNGSGVFKIYKDGSFVEEHVFEQRKCSGWLDCPVLDPDIGRKECVRNPRWYELEQHIQKEIAHFPKIGNENANKRLDRRLLDTFKKMLPDLIPKATKPGMVNDPITEQMYGGESGPKEPGYIQHQKLDPNRIIIHREGGTHNPDNHNAVYINGPRAIKKKSEKKDNHRNEHHNVKTIYYHGGPDKPMLKFYGDRNPGELWVNMDNQEYIILKTEIGHNSYYYLMSTWLTEIKANLLDDQRQVLSDNRVKMLRSTGTYPTITTVMTGTRRMGRPKTNWD